MPTDFTLPELGENIAGGDVVRVLVAAGDSVTKDQPVLELETDKATIEVPSSVSGTVREVKIKQGERVKVGQVILTLDNGAASGQGHWQRRRGREAQATAGRGRGRGRAQSGDARRRDGPARACARARAGTQAEARRGRRYQGRRPRRPGAAAGGGGTARAGRAGRTVRTPSRARARRRYPPRRRQRSGRPHQPRRCAGLRAERLGRGNPRECAVIAARLHQVGRGRAQADEQHPAEDGRASVERLEHHPARHAARQGGHHRARGPAQAGTARKPRRPAAS